MTIPVPVTRTVINSALWGIPLTNEHNRLVNHERSLIAWANQLVTQTGISSAYVNINQMTLTFTAVAGRVYQIEFGTYLAGDAAGSSYSVRLNGLPQADAQAIAGSFGMNDYAVPRFVSRTAMVFRGSGAGFAAGATTLTMQAKTSLGAGNAKINNGLFSVMYIHDLGVDPS